MRPALGHAEYAEPQLTRQPSARDPHHPEDMNDPSGANPKGADINPSKGLPAHAAETLLRLVEVHDMAADVFATEEGASAWLRTPHPLLDNEVPLDAVKTSYGAQLIKNLLMSTKYGGAA